MNNEVIDEFSVSVKLEDIKARNYSLSAGQYFPVKIEYVEMTPEEFTAKMATYQENLSDLFAESERIESDIMVQIGELKL